MEKFEKLKVSCNISKKFTGAKVSNIFHKVSKILPQVLLLVAVIESVEISCYLHENADKKGITSPKKPKTFLLGIKSLGKRKLIFD